MKSTPQDVEPWDDALLAMSTTQLLCRHNLEHLGGAFWCTLPIGHAGDHAVGALVTSSASGDEPGTPPSHWVRRSSRERSSTVPKMSEWTGAPAIWRSLAKDLQQCRLSRATERLQAASSRQLQDLIEYKVGLLGLAVKAAAAGKQTESALLLFIQVALGRGLSAVDTHQGSIRAGAYAGGRPAMVLAAYHGFSCVLQLLLEAQLRTACQVACDTVVDLRQPAVAAVQQEPPSPRPQQRRGDAASRVPDATPSLGRGSEVTAWSEDGEQNAEETWDVIDDAQEEEAALAAAERGVLFSKDAEGNTALMAAARNHQMGCVRLLLQHCPG